MRVVVAWRWLPIVTFATMLLPAMAGGVAAAVSEPNDARSWLARIHAAANQSNYQGTMVFSAGGLLSSSHVAHFCIGLGTRGSSADVLPIHPNRVHPKP